MDRSAARAVPARRLSAWGRSALTLLVTAALLALGTTNIMWRAHWHEAEDGVLWMDRAEGVVAAEVDARSAAWRAGLRPGDLLLAIDAQPVDSTRQVIDVLHRSTVGADLVYTVARAGDQSVRQVHLQPVPQGNRALYFVLAGVAIFTILVGCLVRLQRPSDPATLHFFWLCVAFFGVLGFSFSGKLDRLDWFFYWADVVAVLILPPLFLHFALVFPDRPGAWVRTPMGRAVLPLFYLPACLLGAARVAAMTRPVLPGEMVTPLLALLDRLELVMLGAGLVAGLAVMTHALRRARSVTARRQLRWIVWGTLIGALPFVAGYIVPFAAGFDPWPQVQVLAVPLGLVPLAFASAVVRYRLMDVEVIIKRTVVYAAAVSAIAAIYAVILRIASEAFLGGSEQHNSVIAVLATLVVVLLAPVVKNAIQAGLDRAYYRDRYDYRKALVDFARELNSDLDLERLSERLVERVSHTLALDGMALLLAPAGGRDDDVYSVMSLAGFQPGALPVLRGSSGVGSRLRAGHAVAIDDPIGSRRFAASEVASWRDAGVQYLLPCVSKGGTIAVLALGGKNSGEPLNSEDLALLTAVAAQVATAIENGRLYQQLQLKARELERMREFSDSIIESLSDGLLVVGLDGLIRRWNPALASLYGLSREDAVGQPLEAVFSGSFLDALQASLRETAPGQPRYRLPLVSRHDEGARQLLVNTATAPLRKPDGGLAGTIIIVEDVTERVHLEEQLQISEKMASIGLLAAGVAHEVNTPLTGISSYTQMLLEGAEPDDPRTRLLEKIERQTFRAARIVNGLLNLSRPSQQVDAGPVDVNTVITDVLALIDHQLRSARIQVRKEMDSSGLVLIGLEYKLQQVFLNLFLNARDAMPKGGWLTIATRLEGNQIVVEVGDTGSGIPPEHLARIYDPFFTTKPLGQGTGLGLSIAYGIIKEHGGAITCTSTVGQGTRFQLTLPAAAAARERTPQAAM